MRPALRAVPAPGRFAAALVLLLAALLTAIPAPAVSAADTGPGTAPRPAAAHQHIDPRADAACALDCAVQARARQHHPGERPSLPDHHAADPRGPALPPTDDATYAPAPSPHPASSPGRSAHDRGRAPPATDGI